MVDEVMIMEYYADKEASQKGYRLLAEEFDLKGKNKYVGVDRRMENKPKMQLVMQMGSGYGLDQGAWRMPNADPDAYTNIDVQVELAKIAERGKIQMIFFADTPALTSDISNQPPQSPMDPIVLLTALARETERIGLLTTISTTFNHPYNVARQLKALDVVSNGRIGVNFVTTSNPGAAMNFGDKVPSRQERYEQAHEFIQIVQGLWGSWEEDALSA